MERIWTTVVPDRWDGKRAGVYLRRELGLSAGLLARVKRTPGGLLRNGLPLRSDEILRRGDTVSVLLEREGARSEAISPEPGELSILFEDQDLLIVDKPAGLPVHQPAGRPGPSLGSIVLAHYGAEGQSFVFRPVHRLDRGTSGVMVIAKNPYVQEKLKGQMHTGDFQREYLALVMGTPDPPEGIIRAPIGRKDGSVLLREVREDGSPAVTRYETILTGGKVHAFTLNSRNREDASDPRPPELSGPPRSGGFPVRDGGAGDPLPSGAPLLRFVPAASHDGGEAPAGGPSPRGHGASSYGNGTCLIENKAPRIPYPGSFVLPCYRDLSGSASVPAGFSSGFQYLAPLAVLQRSRWSTSSLRRRK